jgi:DNA-binding LytR/AlgR family response regulator
MKVLIVEDEVLVAEDLAADLADMGFDAIDIAISGEECFASFEKNKPDVILMDIRIKGELSGIEVAKKLKEKASTPIIYLSSNTDSATMKQAIESHPQSFISKPYNRKDLKAAIEIAFIHYNQKELENANKDKPLQTSVFVKNGEFYQRVELNEILYIEAAGSYSTVFTEKKTYTLSTNLLSFENKVENSNFIRIHRSYIVNISKIEGFAQHSVIINQKELPISPSHRDEVFKLFHKL